MRWDTLALGLLVAGCAAGAPPASAPPPRAPRAARAPAAGRASCEVRGSRGEQLTVRAPGGVELSVTVLDGELALAPTDDPTRARVHVAAPLRFDAIADPAAQPLELARAERLAAGAVEASAGARVRSVEVTPRGLRAWVVLGRRDPTAPRGLELAVGPVPLGCDQLHLRATEDPPAPSVPPRRPPAAPLTVVTQPPLVLRPVRIAPAELRVRPTDRAMIVPAWVVDRRGDQVRVLVPFADGSRLAGWADAGALRDPTPEEADAIGRSTEAPRRDAPGLDALIDGLPGDAPSGVITAELRASTPVRAAPGDGPWARSVGALEVRARIREGETWAQLLDVPGIRLDPSRAWVPRDALSEAR